MAAIAFVVPLTAGSHSGEVGKDGCHAGGEPYHCHFRMSKSSWIRPDPPGTPVYRIGRAGREPGRHRGMPAGRSPDVLEKSSRATETSSRDAGKTFSGRARRPTKVVDGDTIEIAGDQIRLHGIDAFEGRQRCWRADGTPWACGRVAARELRKKIAGGRTSCREHGRDQYDRALGTCYANGVDLNGWMVSQGLALAYRRYSRRYVGDENAARAARAGAHSGKYEPPWEWRRRNN